MVKNVTYHNPINQEENTPLVTILETRVDIKQSTAVDSRKAPYVIDLTKASFGGIYYPVPGTQWYLKKISGVWALMARAPQQNPQLNPSFVPVIGDTYIGSEGTTNVAKNLKVPGATTAGSLSLTGDFNYGSKVSGRGYIGANTYIANVNIGATATSSTEVAFPSATWGNEPTYAFLNNHLYRVELTGCLTAGAGTLPAYSVVILRKGSATTSGTELYRWEHLRALAGVGQDMSSRGWIKNTSGSTVNSKLSLSHFLAAGSSVVMAGGPDRPLVVAVYDVGLVGDHAEITSIAKSV
jgi:hypothetical protein